MPHDLLISLASRKFFQTVNIYDCSQVQIAKKWHERCETESRLLYVELALYSIRFQFSAESRETTLMLSRCALLPRAKSPNENGTQGRRKEENERELTDRSKSSNFYSNEHTNQVNECVCACRIMTCSIHISLVCFQVYIKLWEKVFSSRIGN